MKRNIFMLILLSIFVVEGCTRNSTMNKQTEIQNGNIKEKTTQEIHADVNDSDCEITINTNDEDYNICGLKISDNYKEIIKTLGEPTEKGYEVVGTFKLETQFLHTHMYYDNVIITYRDAFDSDDIDGLEEIDVYGGNFTTSKGIKVGDNIDKVTKEYDIKYVFNYGKTKYSNIANDFYNRVNKLELFSKRIYSYDYGEIDKIAYVVYGKRDEKHYFPPALVFLINDDTVTHIILYNAFEKL